MDLDEFAKATKLGRQVRRKLELALDGGPWDDCLPRLFFQVILSREISSLVTVFTYAIEVQNADLFRPPDIEVIDEFDRRCRDSGGSTLDRILREEAKRAAALGIVEPRAIALRFVNQVFARYVLDGRGGLRESRGDSYVRQRYAEIHQLLAPTFSDVAKDLLRRPQAVRRNFTAQYHLTAESDLLGSVSSEP